MAGARFIEIEELQLILPHDLRFPASPFNSGNGYETEMMR